MATWVQKQIAYAQPRRIGGLRKSVTPGEISRSPKMRLGKLMLSGDESLVFLILDSADRLICELIAIGDFLVWAASIGYMFG